MQGSPAVPPSSTEKAKGPGTAKRKKVNHGMIYLNVLLRRTDERQPVCTADGLT